VNLYFYTYNVYNPPDNSGQTVMAFNFVIAPDPDTAFTFLPFDPVTGLQPTLNTTGSITCDGPARVVAGIPIGILQPLP
jgi:hypothetical protein